MDQLAYLFAAAVATAAALAAIAVWSPRALWLKLAALGLAGLLMATAHAGLAELLSRPKPVSLVWASRAVPEATVHAAKAVEGEAIYLWLVFDGEPEPRAYVLPWSLQAAKGLDEAMRQAAAEGTAVRVRRPFDAPSEESERMFYAAPQPALPPKSAPPLSKTGAS